VIVRFPPGKALVVKVACPLDTLALLSRFAPSKNCTLPVGAAPLVAMVAVKVTACPSADGFGLLEIDTKGVGT
jgi:hypothetical protein